MSNRAARAATHRPIAPAVHTLGIVCVIVAVAVAGSLLEHSTKVRADPAQAAHRGRIVVHYLPLLAANAMLLSYVSWPFRRRWLLTELVGERWPTLRRALGDVLLALGSATLICFVEQVSRSLSGLGRNAALSGLLPSTGAERLTWLLVASFVGFSEEVVYRGYLQRQFRALTGHAALAIPLQAALFALAHLEQGPGPALRIGGYGLLLGLLAEYRRSLLPGIVCHVGIDLASVFVR